LYFSIGAHFEPLDLIDNDNVKRIKWPHGLHRGSGTQRHIGHRLLSWVCGQDRFPGLPRSPIKEIFILFVLGQSFIETGAKTTTW